MGLLSTIGAASGRAFGLTRVGAAIKDAYFNLVTLLLPGNGTNGAQNNTFLDSSTNNFTITRNGNTTQGTFSPFSQTGWGNYFDGNDELSIAANAAFQFGTGDFTIEGWIYTDSSTETFGKRIVSKYASAGNGGWLLEVLRTSGNTVRFLWYNATPTLVVDLGTNDALAANAWHHIAVSRSGANVSLFVDGVRKATSASVSGATDNFSATVYVGSGGASDTYTDGYLSNIRLVKGTAVYDPTQTSITVPTAPLTAITNTSLLTCQSNRFVDNSSNAFAITANGNPSVQAFSPFAPTAAYSAATNGSSGYFDGTGDYLSVGAAADWAFMSNSTAAWTIECWIYNDTSGTETNYFVTNSGSTVNTGIFVVKTTSETVRVGITRSVTASYVVDVTTTGTLVKNAWNHLFVSYDQSLASSNCKIYINGTSAGTGNKTANAPSSSNPATALYIGTYNGSAGFISGYVSSLRISNSVRSVPSGVPTSPYTSDANTKLLANFTNAGITDATAKNDLETVGNAQISTTQSKFGGSSMYFDGNGDGLYEPYSQNYVFRTGNWTIEFWMYFSSKTGFQTIMSFGYTNGSAQNWLLQTGNGDGKLNLYSGVSTIATDAGSTVNTGQWYHIAVVKNGSTTTIYRDGVSVGSGTDTVDYNPTNTSALYIGGGSNTGFNNYYFNGYLDDIRITKGYARYTSAFTPPTAAFALS